MKPVTVVLAVALALGGFPSYAQDLGTHGNVYPIDEEDVVVYIKRRLTEFEKDGEVARRQEAARARVRETMLHPQPIQGITTAKENNVFYYDPTFVQPKNAVDSNGRIIVAAGTTINPLRYGGLTHKYVFIDERDPKQVDFVIKNFSANREDRIVLTGGSWVDLSKKMKRQVYYDQGGALTRRFGITKVPAVLSQDGLRLKIEEKAL